MAMGRGLSSTRSNVRSQREAEFLLDGRVFMDFTFAEVDDACLYLLPNLKLVKQILPRSIHGQITDNPQSLRF
jgi:hypothetical protein